LKALANTNITPFDPIITLQEPHAINAHKSGLIWFYGLSGSGKSTLTHHVEACLYQKGIRCYVLGGDNVIRKDFIVGLNKVKFMI
jgi:adenylylsulfate kinase